MALENAAQPTEEQQATADEDFGSQTQEQISAGEQSAQEEPIAETPSPVEKALNDLSDEEDSPEGDDETEPSAAKPTETHPAEPPKRPLTEEEEEASLLEGVKTSRGKERLQRLLSDGRTSRKQIQAFQQVIQSAGLDRDSFANLISICRLCSSADERDRTQGLAMLEQVRSEVYKTLGQEAPGVDLLDGFEDLKAKVKDFQMERSDALQIAKARMMEAERKKQQSEALSVQQEAAAMQQRCQNFSQTAMSTFRARTSDPDFDARMMKIYDYFQQPGRIQEFVKSHQPEEWTSALMWLYENATPTSTPRQQVTPLTQNRTRSVGRAAVTRDGTPAGIMAHIEEMGL